MPGGIGLSPRWDRYLTQVWQGELDVGAAPAPGSGLGWRSAVRLLTTVTEEVRQLGPTDTPAWTHATGQTADLVAVLSRRLEPKPGPLYHAGQHLARAAQLDPHHGRPAARATGRPLLVDVARLVAHSRDPAQTAAIAAVVLLVYGVVRLLDHIAAQHHAQVAVRRQLQLAADCIAEHPHVANYPAGATTGQTPVSSQRPMVEVDHLRRAARTEANPHQARRR